MKKIKLLIIIALLLSFTALSVHGPFVSADGQIPVSLADNKYAPFNVYDNYWGIKSSNISVNAGSDITMYIPPQVAGLVNRYGGVYSEIFWLDSAEYIISSQQFGLSGDLPAGWITFESPSVNAVYFSFVFMTTSSTTPTTIFQGLDNYFYMNYTDVIANSFIYDNPDDALNSAIYGAGYEDGVFDGYDDGYVVGYDDGIAADINAVSIWQSTINGIGAIFSLELFPNVTLGLILSAFIGFYFIKWFLGIIRG